MNSKDFKKIEDYMKSCMKDSAHDQEHIYRVLYLALDIAEHERQLGNVVDYEILITACLLHDIGREMQFKKKICHAKAGSKMAKEFLMTIGWTKKRAKLVADCIKTHRYRSNETPESLEAKILFDADKVDVTGAVGIARTLIYAGTIGAAMYSHVDLERESRKAKEKDCFEQGNDFKIGQNPCKSREDTFCNEYHFKLQILYGKMHTKKGEELAKVRQEHAEGFYANLMKEILPAYADGTRALKKMLEDF